MRGEPPGQVPTARGSLQEETPSRKQTHCFSFVTRSSEYHGALRAQYRGGLFPGGLPARGASIRAGRGGLALEQVGEEQAARTAAPVTG